MAEEGGGAEEEEAAAAAVVGNARPYTPPDDEPPQEPPPAAEPLPPTDGLAGESRNAALPAPPPKVDEKEHAYRAGARVAPAAPSRQERAWRGLPTSQWDQRKNRLAGRHLKASELDSKLKARKAAATRRASVAVLRTSVDAEAARARGDGVKAAAADGQRDVEEERLYREMTSAYRAAAAAAPKRGGGGGSRGLHKTHPLALEREGLPSSSLPASAQQDIAEAHPHFRQALRAHGLVHQADASVREARSLADVRQARSKPTVESAMPSVPRADMLRQCKAEVARGAEDTRYAVRAAARRAQPSWHREAHVLAARCEANPLPKRRDNRGDQDRRPGSAPAVAHADGRWPMASADGRWRRAGTENGETAAVAATAGGVGRSAALPEIVVFSVDETLWQGEIWLSSSGPPYTPAAVEGAQHGRLGAVVDSGGNEFALRQDALRILREVSTVWPQCRGVSRLCFVASTAAPEWTAAALRAVKIRAGRAGSVDAESGHEKTDRGAGLSSSKGRGRGESMAEVAGSIHMCGADSIKPALRALQKERDSSFSSMLFFGAIHCAHAMGEFECSLSERYLMIHGV
eukprot:COSAG02_NODE_1577_length_11862_cov_13.243135_1_plen_577_part_00